MSRSPGALWLVCLTAAVLAQDDLLSQDDECATLGAEKCAANALQLKGAAVNSEETAAVSAEWDVPTPKNGSVGECGDCMMANHEGGGEQLLGAGPRIWHYAQNCWYTCGRKAGACNHFCGPGNACCRYRFPGPPECQRVGFWPSLSYHTCVVSAMPPPPAPSTPEGPPLPDVAPATGDQDDALKMKEGSKSDALYRPPVPSLLSPSTAPLLEFYVYRAMSDSSYPLENVNAANAAGVMWYLHNEVIIWTPRKFGITRIVRFKVQYKAPEPLHEKGMNFGVRYAFDSGKCTGPGDCSSDYGKYGYFVGCNLVYNFPTNQFKDAKYYGDPTWYAFPGPCYTNTYRNHDDMCVQSKPGGACPGSPSGRGDCTYQYEPAGEVSVDEVVGIKDYASFLKNGGKEYIPGLGTGAQMCRQQPWLCDKGAGMSFWNDKHNEHYNQMRVQRLKDTFQKKYPTSPILADVPCDFKEYQFYH